MATINVTQPVFSEFAGVQTVIGPTSTVSPLSSVPQADVIVTGSTVISTDTSTSWTTEALASIASVSFMRARVITFTAKGCKPNTKMYPYFDGIRVDAFVRPAGGSLGGSLVTSALGTLSGEFNVPANTFNAGTRNFILSQSPSATLNGQLVGDAVAAYTSFSYDKSIKTSNSSTTNTSIVVAGPTSTENVASTTQVNTTNTGVVVGPTAAGTTSTAQESTSDYYVVVGPCNTRTDPIAQSFNTYGLTDGVFISSIDLFFASKSSTEPVTLDLRRMLNGYPSDVSVSEESFVVKPADAISISSDASVPSKFTFKYPVYLEPNSDFCFVLKSNSVDYNLYVSDMGGISIETGKMITEQPNVGSVFKSENDYTWTAEQYKDIKFNLNRAKFNVSVPGIISCAISPGAYNVNSNNLYTTSGSNIVRVDMIRYKHGFDTSSKVQVATGGSAASTYNGFTFAQMNGTFNVANIVSEYIFDFVLPVGTATSTGFISTSGGISEVSVNDGGQNYLAPVITFSGGGGSGASATAYVVGGKISKITVTARGSGYTSTPTVIVSDTTGTGAAFSAIVADLFVIRTNNVANTLAVYSPTHTVSGTSILTNMNTTDTSYSASDVIALNTNNSNKLYKNVLIASRANEVARMGSNDSAVIQYYLRSTSDYVSPAIHFKNAKITTTAFNINNQPGETVDIAVTAGTTSVTGFNITNVGSGYTSAPTVTIDAPKFGGVRATATATVAGNILTGFSITNAGSGYVEIPNVTFSGGGGSGAAATAQVAQFNSELTSIYGKAYSRYISNKTRLETGSRFAVVYVDAYSNANSSFEVYIRTSLAADTSIHEELGWRMLSCPISRNKSTKKDQFLEYKFTLDNIPEFDTYDLKIVLRSNTTYDPPIISNYRSIITV